jgi:prepilin-type N-terminal cleavage/methylation domain-containing protein
MRKTLFQGKKLDGSEGFTLIEVIVAVFVFSIGILATVSMQISSLQGNSIANSNTVAASIAATVIEELRPLAYNDPALAPGPHALPDQDRYTVSYEVQQDVIIANTLSIQVTIDWADGGTQRTVNIDYLLSDTI